MLWRADLQACNSNNQGQLKLEKRGLIHAAVSLAGKALCLQDMVAQAPQTDYQRALNIMSNSEDMGVPVPKLRHPSLPYILLKFRR